MRDEQYVLFSAEVRATVTFIALNPLQIINSCSMFLLSRAIVHFMTMYSIGTRERGGTLYPH